MPVKYLFEIKDEYLYIKVEGSLSSEEEMVNYIDTMHAKRLQVGVSRVLVNESKCHMHMHFDELMKVANELRGHRWLLDNLQTSKVAIVTSNANHPLFQHAMESVPSLTVFTDMDAAKNWLIEE